jgi:spore germination protein GerM
VTAPRVPCPHRRRRQLGVLALTGVAALAGACGLSTDAEPESITDATVDATTSTTGAALGAAEGDTDNVTVYFLVTVDDTAEVLTAVQRPVPLPATPTTRLEALFTQPPTAEERDEGLRSAIPADATLAERPRRVGDELIVDLPEGVYEQLHGGIAQDAFAQIVYTATAIPGVDAVAFERDGAPFEPVDGTGQAQSEPLTRADFPDLAPTEG